MLAGEDGAFNAFSANILLCVFRFVLVRIGGDTDTCSQAGTFNTFAILQGQNIEALLHDAGVRH
jgi:hypothetical protein